MQTPPGVSPAARRWARRLVTPIEAFLRIEASSGIVLLGMAALAIAIASSAWSESFHRLLELPLGLRVGAATVERPLHFWINDGLMTIFFFVVGLEIRREIHAGELANVRRAALPLAAALGGMAAPALLYLAIAGGDPADRPGWGVPMATDIAFAVGVLAILGKRVPPALRVLLLALAIIDDIGSIVVIATFYSGALDTSGFVIAAGGVAFILFLQRVGVRRASVYVIPGVIVWFGITRSGVHPTIAGVIVGLLTPATPWLGAAGLAALARRSAEEVEHELEDVGGGEVAADRLAAEASRIDLASREALAPATRLQRMLHPWVAFVIMPIFALTNAGVTVNGHAAAPSLLGAGIIVGLVVGKPVGILAACFAVVRLRIASLPRGIGWRELTVLGLVAGIGFTMALFVAALAFPKGDLLEQAKLAILAASVLAMILGLAAGRALLAREVAPDAAASCSEAETSDEV
ncbi:MAG: Na+/H+ antiporter NhaA [Labilithrix sp.]|nr:Na+/H+ antiporter NhaA [Labilithrix sp.]